MLTGNPKKFKIGIAEKDYFCSSAIAVLRINDQKTRQNIFNYFKNNENGVLEQLFFLSDGFKATYLKISSENLLNNIKIKI
ncbi:hypothetical protein MYMA111404_02275 [Mycoplasma marinum]|uniref:Uncharacterized protein n=1 Tax=Mycoplasma marinum TaxID=1937190 RepID=A0A4R0XUG7_9MOLU|nr:hypothetical protein [Mycoplasma marinum]TCG11329.1 hypothetical protein C4B24_02140 [Mycoplasma marinum]